MKQTHSSRNSAKRPQPSARNPRSFGKWTFGRRPPCEGPNTASWSWQYRKHICAKNVYSNDIIIFRYQYFCNVRLFLKLRHKAKSCRLLKNYLSEKNNTVIIKEIASMSLIPSTMKPKRSFFIYSPSLWLRYVYLHR